MHGEPSKSFLKTSMSLFKEVLLETIRKHEYDKDLYLGPRGGVLEVVGVGKDAGGRPVRFISTTTGTCRSSWCRVMIKRCKNIERVFCLGLGFPYFCLSARRILYLLSWNCIERKISPRGPNFQIWNPESRSKKENLVWIKGLTIFDCRFGFSTPNCIYCQP